MREHRPVVIENLRSYKFDETSVLSSHCYLNPSGARHTVKSTISYCWISQRLCNEPHSNELPETSIPQESHINKKQIISYSQSRSSSNGSTNQLRSPRTCTRWPRLDRRHSQINDAAPNPSKRSETSCTSARRTYGSRSRGKAARPSFTPDISVHSR